jgi:outer membrane lipoprotein-sorting protein
MKRKNAGTGAVMTALLGMLLISTAAASAQTSGREVMDKVYHRPTSETMSATLVMTITNARGSSRERSITQYRLDTAEAEKKIMFFTAPADVRDTSFMTWSWEDGRQDDQWIYLPALKRVRRIASDSKNESFMGSDFTYDDLGERHPASDRHTILREETIAGKECYVLESVPVDRSEGNSKTISWVIKDLWIGLKRDYYDTRDRLYKTLEIDSFEEIDGYYVITDMSMKDLGKNSSTRIEMDDVSFTADLEESFFTERQMRMGPRR